MTARAVMPSEFDRVEKDFSLSVVCLITREESLETCQVPQVGRINSLISGLRAFGVNSSLDSSNRTDRWIMFSGGDFQPRPFNCSYREIYSVAVSGKLQCSGS